MRKALFILLASLLPLGLGAQTPAQEDPDIQYASTLLAPGSKAPDFTLGTMDGRPFSLSSLAGRMVVLVFWASWCPDCRAELPELKAMYEAVSKDKVAFVSVSFDRGLDALKAPEYELLARRMVTTVTDPSQDGVGIAGPQVGVLRRVVAVQRLDKEAHHR